MVFDVIVIGGGLHGASAALQLARRGRRTLVLERAHVGRHASGASAGGVRTLGRDEAEIALAVAGMELWRRIADLVEDDCGFHAHGQVKVAENAAEMAALEERAARVRALGFPHERIVDAAGLRRLVPAIASHCLGALVVDDDGAADPFRTTQAFRAAAERLGAAVREGDGVTGIERKGDRWRVTTPQGTHEAPLVVNAAGAWAAEVAAMVGDDIPITTRCSMMIVTERVAPFIAPVVGAHGRKLSFKQAENGTVLIGGGQQGRPDLDGEAYALDMRNLARAAAAATALFPGVGPLNVVRAWAGLEAETPDRLPVIGLSPGAPGVIHVCGFSGHGFQLGPIVGSAVADLAVHGQTNLPIAAFGLQRFLGTTPPP